MRSIFAADDVIPAGTVNRVAVIGAGIVGSSIAYNLSKRGCEVILIDKRGPATQASGNSFAWLNATYFDRPPSYYNLRTHSLGEYHRLSQEVDFPVRWGGSLEWYDLPDQQKEVVEGVRRIQQSGDPTWMIGKDRIAGIEPNLHLAEDQQAAWASRHGAIDPGAATRALVDRVIANGGSTVFPALVTGISERANGMLVEADVASFEVDLVVSAAGINANEIAAMIGLGTTLLKPATPGIIVTTRPMEPLLNTVCATLTAHLHQRHDGRVILGEGVGAPDTDLHRSYVAGQPNVYPTVELAMEHAQRIIGAASRFVPDVAKVDVESVGVGWRPLPLDGLPVIGRPKKMPGMYLAAMHSGVTLAPIVGHLAAMEILDGVSVDLLSDFRVERFL